MALQYVPARASRKVTYPFFRDLVMDAPLAFSNRARECRDEEDAVVIATGGDCRRPTGATRYLVDSSVVAAGDRSLASAKRFSQ